MVGRKERKKNYCEEKQVTYFNAASDDDKIRNEFCFLDDHVSKDKIALIVMIIMGGCRHFLVIWLTIDRARRIIFLPYQRYKDQVRLHVTAGWL